LAAVAIGVWAGALIQPAMAEKIPFCAAWPEKAEELGPYISGLARGEGGWIFNDRGDFALTGWLPDRDLAAWQRFVAALKQHGTTLVVIVPPPRGLVEAEHVDPGQMDPEKLDYARLAEGYDVFIESLRAAGAVAPNLLRAVEAARKQAPLQFYYQRDIHWRPEGARVVAAAVRAALDGNEAYAALPKRDFATRIGETMIPIEIWTDTIVGICGGEKNYETAPRYITEDTGEGGGEAADAASALLGEAGVPQVVLAGTSLSFRGDGSDANFAGFLKEALEADVLNVAIPGGGLLTSITSYVTSPDFRSAPPKLLVWEFRPFDPATELELRQLQPALIGSCIDGAVALARQQTLDRGRTVVLELDDAAAAALPKDGYLDLSLSDPAIKQFDATVDYADGSRDVLAVDITRAQVATGHYFLDLPQGADQGLRRVTVRPKTPASGSAKVSVCRPPEPAL
jgi:alginate biosynthesis protein AlgX